MKKIIFTVFSIMMLAGCASTPEAPVIGNVSELYNQGLDELMAGEYTKSIHTFEELERQHPYSGWSTRAQMLIAYAHFLRNDLDETIVAADRFARLHPGHSNLDYIYYLKGLAYYVQISDIKRDQGYTREAMQAFEVVINRFPDSVYARDAALKLTLTRDHLAAKELDVGKYYQKQKRYLAALNRFKDVIRNYEKTNQVPEALYRAVEVNIALGLPGEAQKYAAVLGYNYPSSPWYKDAYNLLTDNNLATKGDERNWLEKMGQGVKDIF